MTGLGEMDLCPKCNHSVGLHFKMGEPKPENKNCRIEGCMCPMDYSKGGLSKLDSVTDELRDISQKF